MEISSLGCPADPEELNPPLGRHCRGSEQVHVLIFLISLCSCSAAVSSAQGLSCPRSWRRDSPGVCSSCRDPKTAHGPFPAPAHSPSRAFQSCEVLVSPGSPQLSPAVEWGWGWGDGDGASLIPGQE